MESALGFGELQAMGVLFDAPAAVRRNRVGGAAARPSATGATRIAMPTASLRDAAERSRFYTGLGLNRALTDFTPRGLRREPGRRRTGRRDRGTPKRGGRRRGRRPSPAPRAAFRPVAALSKREVRRFVDRAHAGRAFGDGWIAQRTPAGHERPMDSKNANTARRQGRDRRPADRLRRLHRTTRPSSSAATTGAPSSGTCFERQEDVAGILPAPLFRFGSARCTPAPSRWTTRST